MDYHVTELFKPDLGKIRVCTVNEVLYAARVDLCKIVYGGHAPNNADSLFSPHFFHTDKVCTEMLIPIPNVKRGRKKIIFLKAADVISRLLVSISFVKLEKRKAKRIALRDWLLELLESKQHNSIATIDTGTLFYNHNLGERKMQEKPPIGIISQAPIEVTTFTVADINDIKDRAEALKQAFDVSKSAALTAVISLKEEEIGRKLDALRELLKKER